MITLIRLYRFTTCLKTIIQSDIIHTNLHSHEYVIIFIIIIINIFITLWNVTTNNADNPTLRAVKSDNLLKENFIFVNTSAQCLY